jgi:hypothetical protein
MEEAHVKHRTFKLFGIVLAMLASSALMSPAHAGSKPVHPPQPKALGTNLPCRIVLVINDDNQALVVSMASGFTQYTRFVTPQQPFAIFLVPLGNVPSLGWTVGKTANWGSSQFPPDSTFYVLGTSITPGLSVVFTSQLIVPWIYVYGF